MDPPRTSQPTLTGLYPGQAGAQPWIPPRRILTRMAVGLQETRPEPASQTLTFLFTDIEGSTRLWEHHQQSMKDALERHDAILRTAVEGSNGQVVKNIGDGFMAVFGSAVDGVCACLNAQQGLATAQWGETGPLRVRMGLHVGEAATREGDYYGPTLNRTARIMGAGHGGQVLLSAAAAALVVDQLPDGSSLRDLGEHPLKGLGRAERVFQLAHPDLPASFPPLVTPARRLVKLPEQPSAFVGRDAQLNEIADRLADDSVRLLTLTGRAASVRRGSRSGPPPTPRTASRTACSSSTSPPRPTPSRCSPQSPT